jgi:hypothetical protein
LTYFKKASWEMDWINTAEEIVRAEFQRSYVKGDEETATMQEEVSSGRSCCVTSLMIRTVGGTYTWQHV